MSKLPFQWTIVALILILAACTNSVQTRRDNAYDIATQAGFQPLVLRTPFIKLAGFYKKGSSNLEPIIYIEGDGFAWIDRYTVSKNPTPKTPLALKLAVLDKSPTVIYLARPCQYIDLKQEQNCSSSLWTQARFSQEIVSSYHHALRKIQTTLNAKGFHLVGFSGGGAIASLVANQNSSILSLRTIAGNLDHASLNKLKKVTPLTESLNPVSNIKNITNIPQIHYSGSQDKIIPQWVAQSFIKKINNPSCAYHQVIEEATHLQGWQDIWSYLHTQIPKCS